MMVGHIPLFRENFIAILADQIRAATGWRSRVHAAFSFPRPMSDKILG
jgi:hypothetical protein